MTIYLMEQSAFEDLQNVLKKTEIKSAAEYDIESKASGLKISGGVAQIDIVGVLNPERVKLFDYFGLKQTAYSDIKKQIAEAQNSDAKSIVFNVDSGGGNVQGMLETMNAIRGAGMPTTARVNGVAASAAYMLASQADTVEATSKLDIVGSIGVVTGRYVDSNLVEITNTESPNKRPDVTTDEGQAAIRETLDDIYNTVIPEIATARRTTVEVINKTYGQGNIMTAKKALKNKMIDSIVTEQGAVADNNNAENTAKTQGENSMNIDELKAKHPDVYAAIYESGVADGKQLSQKMAKAHMNLAEGSGDTQKALEDIANGVEASDPEVYSYHQMKTLKKAQIDARDTEAADEVGAGDDANDVDETAKNQKAMIAAYKACGIDVEVE